MEEQIMVRMRRQTKAALDMIAARESGLQSKHFTLNDAFEFIIQTHEPEIAQAVGLSDQSEAKEQSEEAA